MLFAAGAAAAAPPRATRDEALRRAAELAAKVDDRFQRTWLRYAVAAEWARTDPAAAAELADRLESWTAKRDLLAVVLFAWGREDPNAAGEWGVKFKARTAGPLAVRNTALHYAVVGMARRDPNRAETLTWQHLHEEGWGGHPRTAPLAVARELAEVDPPAALALAAKIRHERCRTDALRAVLRAWAAKDPQAARRALAGRKEPGLRKAFDRDLVEGWARKDPAAAARHARTIADARTKAMALALAARALARTDGPAAAALCSTAAPLSAGRWHEQMPRIAALVREVAEACARRDPRGAARWAAALPATNGGCRREALDGVAAGWADKDPAAARAFYHAAEAGARPAPNRGTGAAYPAIARALARTDAAAALALVKRTRRLVLKSRIVHDVAVELARRDGPASARVVDEWAGVTDYYTYRAAAASAVAAAWARKDPAAAAAWAAALKPAADRHAAVRAAAAAWADASPAAARAWADARKDPADAIHALVGLACCLRNDARSNSCFVAKRYFAE